MRYLSFRYALLFVLCAFYAAGVAQAQVLRTVKIELTDATDGLAIGPEIYVSRDESRNLGYNNVITRHLNNQRGFRESGSVVNLGMGGVPAWLLFSVENKSAREDWILDFGSPAQGRYAFASRLLVRNHSEGKTILRALREEGSAQEGSIMDSRIAMSIPSGKTSLFVVYIEPFPGFSGTISPRILHHDQGVSDGPGLNFGMLGLGFALSMAGFFAALSLARRSYGTLFFSLYYLLNAGFLVFWGNIFLLNIALTGAIAPLILGAILLTGLGMTRGFLDLGEEQEHEKMGVVVCAVLVVAATIFSFSGFFTQELYSQIALAAASLITAGFIAIAGFMQTGRASYGAPHYAIAWLFVLGGLIIFVLGTSGVLEPGPIVMNAYWLSLLPQGVFFVTGMLKKIQTQEDQEQQAQIRQLREAQTISKLKQTKENTDQSRLLRVIEREREVMAEMREKEMRRTEEMRVAMEHADEANRAKSAFLAVVSHEIRTPMTGIMGMVKLLQGTKLGSEQNDYVLAVQKSGDTMMALLNDILDFEKIESGNMELEHIDFDMHKLVGGVVTLMSGQATEKGIYLKSDIPEDIPKYVRGDPTRLRQVMLNLVGNATKFTDTGGVTIHLRSTPLNEKIGKIKADYEIYFAIEDTGIGISQEVQENLFSPFAQAEKSTTRKYGGTGLGLAICKKLIEAMGSSIRVSSEQGAGSTFYFTLLMEGGRAELAEDVSEKKGRPSDYKTDPRHILVVEDNEMNRRVFTGLLEKEGHKVVTAPSGEEGLKKHQAMTFDLIISDVNMDGMSGMDLTRAIRAMEDPVKASIPVIALTGNVRPQDIEEFYAANMNGFLAKPIDPDKLAMMIKEFSERRLDHPVILQGGRDALPDEQDKNIDQNKDSDFLPLVSDTKENLGQQPEGQAREEVIPKAFELNPEELEIDSFSEAVDEIAVNARNDNEPGSQEFAVPSDNSGADRYREMFDFDLLEQLAGSLGKSQFHALINDYIEHADRIVDALSDARDMEDIKEIKTRAHELKGMAANFGVQSVSRIAGLAEAAALKNQTQEAMDALKDIVAVNKDTNAALREWMDSKS